MNYSKQTLNFLEGIKGRYLHPSMHAGLRERMQTIDRYIQRTVDTSREAQEAKAAIDAGKRDKHRNLEVPICLQQVETAHADLVGTFLTGYPIFAFAGSVNTPETIPVSIMYNALIERDQDLFRWVSSIQKSLRDALRYNIMCAEVCWEEQTSSALILKDGKRVTKSISHKGNCVDYLDPYNFFFDETVGFNEISRHGSHCGYVERMNYLRVKTFLQELDKQFTVTGNFSKALDNGAAEGSGLYFTPDIHPLDTTGRGNKEPDWSKLFGMVSKNASSGACGRYEVVTMYVRIIPQEYGITAARSGTAAPFKLIWVGESLVYIEPLNYVHGMFPVVAAHGYDDNLGFNSKSFVENVLDMQDVATSMMNGSIASMRRAVSDRALYNPTLIRSDDINSANPAAKIPVRGTAFNQNLSAAYHSIPFEDRLSPYMMQHMQTVMGISNSATGLNQASQGAFVKGNKTLEEFSTVMDKSGARQQKFNLDVDNNFFNPMKRMIKLNYMQFAEAEQLMSKSEGKPVQIDPVQMMDSEADYKMLDGIFPASKAMNTDVMVAAFNTIAQSPELDMEYSRAEIFASMLGAQGVDVSKFKRSPEQIAQLQQQKAQAEAAANAPK